MISSLSKYFYKSDEEGPLENNNECKEKPKATNLDTIIKTNNFLRKLRKIDSTENILNFVQLTEYKKTPKSKSRPNKKRQIQIRTDREDFQDKTRTTNVNIKENSSITSQNCPSELWKDPTKVTRKDKRENIDILMKHDDKTSFYDLVTNEGERKQSTYFDTFSSKSMIQVIPSKNYKNERSEVSILDQEVHVPIKTCASMNGRTDEHINRVPSMTSSFKLPKISSGDVVAGKTLQSSEETHVIKTKSSFKVLTETFSDIKIEQNPQEDFDNANYTTWKTTEMEMKEEENERPPSSIFSLGEFMKDFTIIKSSSRQSVPPYDIKFSQNEKTSINSLIDTTSTEKFVKSINLQSHIKDSDLQETAILFKRNARSIDSIKSDIFNFENSKIPILCKAANHSQGKFAKTLKTNEQVSQKDSCKPNISVKPLIETSIESISYDATVPIITQEDKQNNINKTIPSIESKPYHHELKNEESSTKVSEKLEPKKRTDFKNPSKNLLSSKSSVQVHKKPSRICSNIKSKISIFNASLHNDKSKMLVHSNRKLNKNKEIASRIPLNSGTYNHKNKSFANLIVRRQQEDNVQSKFFSQTFKRDFTRSSFIKSESGDSQHTIKMKSATVKKNPVKVEKSKKSEIHILKKISVVSNFSQKENIFYDEINRCKDLENEILEKIDVYWQSIQNVCTIKNELLNTLDIISFKNIMNQCFLNDRAVNMISKLNEVERIKLKEQCLSATNIYGKNETIKVKEELEKYQEYVKEKISEVAVKKNGSGESSDDLEMRTTLLLESTNIDMELKNQKMTETVLNALTFMSAEHEILTQYCQEIIKKNDEANRKLTEKLIWLERENEKLSTEMFNLKKQSVSDVEIKKKNDQISEIREMFNDIEMKNRYHAQLVENFMKSVKMIENKVEQHSKNLELRVEKTTSQMNIAEMKRTALENTIEQLKQRLEHNQREYDELMNKVDEFRKMVAKLEKKNKVLNKELLRYKYPEHLEKNIQKMITLRNMLVDIVYKSDSGVLPVQDKQLLEIMKSMDHSSSSISIIDSKASCAENSHQTNSNYLISIESTSPSNKE